MIERAFIKQLTPQAIATEYERLVDVCRDAANHLGTAEQCSHTWREVYEYLLATRTADELHRIGDHYIHFPEGIKHVEVLDRE